MPIHKWNGFGLGWVKYWAFITSLDAQGHMCACAHGGVLDCVCTCMYVIERNASNIFDTT